MKSKELFTTESTETAEKSKKDIYCFNLFLYVLRALCGEKNLKRAWFTTVPKGHAKDT